MTGTGRWTAADEDAIELLGDRYRLIEQLGVGGMAVVWRGYDELLGRPVAVKMLASRLANDRAFRHRIRAEARAAARLCHPHIVGVYDYGESARSGRTVPYVVMELVDGDSLASRFARQGRLPWREAVTICAQVAAALAAAHVRGVVHRDITPGNVMLTPMGAKVVDFGISALVGEREAGPDGHLFGTPAYLAPERLDQGEVSPATDVYALGLLLHRALAGRLPWRAKTRTEMLRAHLREAPEPLPPLPGLPDEVAALTTACLAKSPADRPHSVEVARTLAAAAGVAVAVPALPVPSGADPAAADDGAALSTANTTILPWSTATGALPLPGARRGRPALAGTDRTRAVAVAAGLIAVTGLIWAGTGGSSSPADGGQRTDLALGGESTCQVDYALRTDSGRAFRADLTVTNTGVAPIPDWAVTFAFPGDQMLTRNPTSGSGQQGREVSIRPEPGGPETTLPAGGEARFELTGTYAGANPLPVEFRLAGAPCRARVTGVSGEPVDAGGVAAGAVAPVSSPTDSGTQGAGASPDGRTGTGTGTGEGSGQSAKPKPKKPAAKPGKAPGKGQHPGGNGEDSDDDEDSGDEEESGDEGSGDEDEDEGSEDGEN
ncbi:protein kinase domain-containing protein [Plantactinospora sp. CA-290183]|uniref:protein kinase domain-containing protein n=1 Tax=Plantactinospora sp. CA-290183 TaxID=3240006 RepID=UPI003D91F47C